MADENATFINSVRTTISREVPGFSFANVCVTCMGSTRRMRKQNYNKDCRLCGQSFTVVDWKTPRIRTRSVTQICYDCSKLHVVCQGCGLQPQRGVKARFVIPLHIVETQASIDRMRREAERASVANEV